MLHPANARAEAQAQHGEGGEVDLGIAVSVGVMLFDLELALFPLWLSSKASGGGTRQGMAIAWPNRIKDAGGIRTQFHHVIDIVPTILEATGIQAPAMVNGIAQKPIEGVSMAYTFDKENAGAPSRRHTQYFEIFGDRAIYHDG